MVAVAFGIPGVGKSSITKALSEKLRIERVHWGGIAFEIAGEKGLIDQVDKLRVQSLESQREIQLLVAKRIAEKISSDRSQHYLIETHAAIKTPEGYWPGMNQEIISMLKPDVFVIFEADPGHIYHRRKVDPTRERNDDTTLAEVQLHLDITRYYAATFAVMASSTMQVIQNKEGDLDYAIDQTTELLTKFMD